MSAAADLSLPAALARFADQRQAKWLLEPVLPQIIGSAACVERLEIVNAHFKSYLKPSSSWKCSFAVLYRLHVRGGQELGAAQEIVYLKAFSAGRSGAEYARYLGGGDPRPIHLPELDALVWRFPHTPGLPQVADFFAAGRPRSSASEAAAAGIAEVINFRPERRCTLRVSPATVGQSPARYAKCYADDSGLGTYMRMKHLTRLAEQGVIDLRIPRPLDYDDRRRTLWLEEVRGVPLAASLSGWHWRELCRGVGRGLAQLHRYADAGPSAATWTSSLLLDELAHKSKRLIALYPRAAQLIPGLLDELHRTASRLTSHRATVHADFHVGQLLAQHRQVVFCDFDELSRGHPAQDLANFSVDLWLRGQPRVRTRAIAAEMLASYCAEAQSKIEDAALHWYALIALANRAYRVYLQQPPDIDGRMMRILAEIERVRGLLRQDGCLRSVAVAA